MSIRSSGATARALGLGPRCGPYGLIRSLGPGEVDEVLGAFAAEDGGDVLADGGDDAGLAFVGEGGDVGGDEDVVHVVEGAGDAGLLGADVEGGAGDLLGLEGAGEGVLVDDLAA